jgi:hypothetical protein
MTTQWSLRITLMLLTLTCVGTSAHAHAPEGSLLVAGNSLTYRYAMFGEALVASPDSPDQTTFGFMTCEFVPVHGVEPSAFRAECEAPKAPTPMAWRPWSAKGYYGWRADGLHHVTSPTSSEIIVSTKTDGTRWVPRSLLVLGDPVEAMCPASTEPTDGKSVFEEVCWTPTHGPVFFVGVDTSDGIFEASWELLKVRVPGVPGSMKVSVSQAKKLVKGWLWAQNTSRLQNYGWLYGAVFHGVERGAAGTGSFDRTAWLKDRKRLFSRRNRIRIEDMKVLPVGDTTIVLFQQHRDLGGKVDSGLRELRLGLERGRVVIAREEMLYAQAL